MKEVVTETIEVVRYYCDICGSVIDQTRDPVRHCEICDRVMCKHCAMKLEHRTVCLICVGISGNYLKDIENITELYDLWKDTAINEAHRRWKQDSLKYEAI